MPVCFARGCFKRSINFVIHLGLASVAIYQDLPNDERPQARERMLDALVRFTMGGLPALTLEHQSLSSSNETNEPTQEQSIE